ncbi:hypothetical protein CDL15_Pgr008327 [Punica granatum]|uniref:Uncharacterized protein n=1 Tax=Punica granatum TaxID=22663 RepID=A0A218XTL0_PUNGR|nr:hypothetical protein CDL15_Pgr008327 [Punica granatum]PKI77683.1 hypothetical protein CRG98_001913 [Punica granatum]
MFGCENSHVRASWARDWTCMGVYGFGRELRRTVESVGRHGGRQACVEEHGQVRWSSTNVRDTDVHACRGGCSGRTGGCTSARGDGHWNVCPDKHARRQAHMGDTERLALEVGDGCTVHPRARSSPETMKLTLK